jgi:hypothetical protein
VFSQRYGPLNPPVRTGPPDLTWARFDVPGWATVYGADQRVGAFLETLAYAVPDPGLSNLASLFPDGPGPTIDEEWQASGFGHMPSGSVNLQWRTTRSIAQIRPRADLTLIDLCHSQTLGLLRSTVAEWAPTGHRVRTMPNLLDVSALTGPDRALTCSLAWWLASQELPDGSLPSGVRYPSRHGIDQQATALWVDMGRFSPGTDTAHAVEAAIDTVASAQFSDRDPDLQAAAMLLGVTVF